MQPSHEKSFTLLHAIPVRPIREYGELEAANSPYSRHEYKQEVTESSFVGARPFREEDEYDFDTKVERLLAGEMKTQWRFPMHRVWGIAFAFVLYCPW